MATDGDPQASDVVPIRDTPGAADRAAGLPAAAIRDDSLPCRPDRVCCWQRLAQQPELAPAARWAGPALDEPRRGAAPVSEGAPAASWAAALRCATGASAGRRAPASRLWVRRVRRCTTSGSAGEAASPSAGAAASALASAGAGSATSAGTSAAGSSANGSASVAGSGNGAAAGAAFTVFTRRGGGSTAAAGFGGSAAFLPGAGFLPLGAGVSANMSPPGSAMLRCRARRSTNCRPTTSSIVLDALFTSIP